MVYSNKNNKLKHFSIKFKLVNNFYLELLYIKKYSATYL